MRSKAYLRQIRRLDDTVNAKLEQIEVLRDMATKVTSGLSERVQESSTNDKTLNLICKIVELDEEITNNIDSLIDLKHDAMNKIDSLNHEDHKLLLTLRYLNFKTFEQIAVDMGFTFQWIHQLHKRALIDFEKKFYTVDKS